MLSPSQATRRQPAKDDDDDDGLTRSLRQLSLANPEKSPRMRPASSPLRSASSPLQPSSRRSSTASTRSHLLSRSPSQGRDPRAARNSAPALARKASFNSLQSANPALSASRRSSSGVMSPVPRPATVQLEEKPWPTAQSVARDHFRAELDVFHGPEPPLAAETIVILNDAVYGHRFSRPRTSRGALSTIVERPERIKASVLGLSAAYVRLGGRHSLGALPIRPHTSVADVSSIPFRISKTDRRVSLLSPAVTNVHGTKWMEELRAMCLAAESRLAMGGKELQRPGSSRGADAGQKLHEGDLYLCAESLEAIEGALGAVCEAVDAVFTSAHRRAFVGVRPPGHHCSASHPSGFCWVNNVHVGIMHAMLAHGLTHAAIIDFDLHHGDGSQAIAWGHNSRAAAAPRNAAAWKKTSIGYFSIHDINSYPCEMGDEEKVKNASLCIDNAHGQSVWNVHLESWESDDEFWHLYHSRYAVLLDKARRFLRNQAARLRAANQPPKAAIFLSAGFDASEWESEGMQRHQLNVPTDFYSKLSRDVVSLAAEEGLHVDGRVISVLEGGYSDRALASGIFSHLSGLVDDPDQEYCGYDSAWWASAELDKLERPPPASPPRKTRSVTPSTYASPTQASTAKVVDPEKMRRSLSGLSRSVSRPPTPPPPEVPWVVAAHELCRLIVPAGRQTNSCTPEDLNAEATRVRRDRQSMLIGVPPPEPTSRPTSRMALRERKPRIVMPAEEAADQRPKSRRKTVGVPLSSPDEPLARPQSSLSTEPLPRTVDRRLSASSTAAKAKDLPRPESAGVDRPVSATSSRSRSSSKLAAKKTRTAARKEPAPKAAREPHASSPARAGAPAASGPSGSASPGASGNIAGTMDGITSGMKKIRINLITQSQREARERARLEAERAASAGSDGPLVATTRTPTSPSADTRPASSAEHADGTASHATSSAAQPPVEESHPPMSTPDPRQRNSASESSRDVPSHDTQPSGDDALFIPYQPEGTTPVAVSRQGPLTWMAPNTSTPTGSPATPGPKRPGTLFHYTSGIPFAPRPEPQQQDMADTAQGERGAATQLSSVWEVPETPPR